MHTIETVEVHGLAEGVLALGGAVALVVAGLGATFVGRLIGPDLVGGVGGRREVLVDEGSRGPGEALGGGGGGRKEGEENGRSVGCHVWRLTGRRNGRRREGERRGWTAKREATLLRRVSRTATPIFEPTLSRPSANHANTAKPIKGDRSKNKSGHV